MFESKNKAINNPDSIELQTYSWDRLPEDYRHRNTVCLKLDVFQTREVYDRFVKEREAIGGPSYVLPPVPWQAFRNRSRNNLERKFLDSLGDAFGFMEIIERRGKEEMRGGEVIIGNCDVIEQHGYHLTLDNDNIRARGLCRILHGDPELSGKIIWAPSFSYGYTGNAEKTKPGTVGLEYETQRDMVANMYRPLVEEYKPGRVVVFTSHAHPRHLGAVDDALERLDHDFAGTEFFRVFDFDLLEDINERLRKKDLGDRYYTPGHASRSETSTTLAYDRLFDTYFVDIERAKEDRISRTKYQRLGLEKSKENYSNWDGTNGFGDNNPELSSTEEGLEWVQAMKEEAKRLILEGDPVFRLIT